MVVVPANTTIMDHTAAGKRPGNVLIDVTFPAPIKVARICFRNWYTARLTIRATKDRAVLSNKDKDCLKGWYPIVQDLRLMQHAHLETESQLWHSIESKDLVPGAEEESVVGLRFFLYQVCVLPVSVEQTRGSICGDSDEDLNLLNFLDTSEPRTVFQPAYDMNLLKTWFWCNLNPPKPRAHATRTRHAHTPRAHATGRPCARHAHTPRAHATLPLRTPRACHGNATTIPGAQYSRGFTHDTHSHRGTGSR
eukprot:Tamp_22395.p1 GENE.Tamp_22395~~Tamp_22395.p1  ORF type:complete len:279 (-),score=28.29 Tamp_22395:253-1005(-)